MRPMLRLPRLVRRLLPMLLASALAQPVAAAGKESPEDLTDARVLKQFGLPASALSYLVIDAATGKVLEQLHADKGYVPASAIKIATTVAALEVLGADHRFETRLMMTGRISGGVLQGDLYLVGGGDPILTTEEFQGFVDRLKALGIQRVAGRFYFDDSLFPPARSIEADHDQTVAYNPGVGSLSLNFNRLRLIWTRDRKSGELDARIYAKTDKTRVEVDYLKTGFADKNQDAPHGLVYREQGKDRRWLLIQRVRPKGEIWLPVKHPSYMTAHVFRKFAQEAGVNLPDPVRGVSPRDARPVADVKSPELWRIVAKVNWFSNNMGAELLGMGAARRLSQLPLGLAASTLVLQGWWKDKLPKADWKGLSISNHSGLSTETRITAHQLVDILRFAETRRYAGLEYERLLKPYYLGGGRKALPKHVYARAKTGTINYARAVAGYLTTEKKTRLIFAVFVSDFAVREAMKAQGKPYAIPRRGGWMGRSRGLMRAVVRRWALTY